MLSSEIVSGVWGLYGRKGRVWKSKHRGPVVGLPVPLVEHWSCECYSGLFRKECFVFFPLLRLSYRFDLGGSFLSYCRGCVILTSLR